MTLPSLRESKSTGTPRLGPQKVPPANAYEMPSVDIARATAVLAAADDHPPPALAPIAIFAPGFMVTAAAAAGPPCAAAAAMAAARAAAAAAAGASARSRAIRSCSAFHAR